MAQAFLPRHSKVHALSFFQSLSSNRSCQFRNPTACVISRTRKNLAFAAGANLADPIKALCDAAAAHCQGIAIPSGRQTSTRADTGATVAAVRSIRRANSCTAGRSCRCRRFARSLSLPVVLLAHA